MGLLNWKPKKTKYFDPPIPQDDYYVVPDVKLGTCLDIRDLDQYEGDTVEVEITSGTSGSGTDDIKEFDRDAILLFANISLVLSGVGNSANLDYAHSKLILTRNGSETPWKMTCFVDQGSASHANIAANPFIRIKKGDSLTFEWAYQIATIQAFRRSANVSWFYL